MRSSYSRLPVAVLALPMAFAAARVVLQPTLTDPRGIAPAIGVSATALREAHCVRRRNPSAPPGARGSWTCMAGPTEFARLLPTRGSWILETDSVDVIYSGGYNWRLPLSSVAARRDSIARALSARGLTHVHCADSVDTRSQGHPTWLSRFRGASYNALLFHVLDGDSAQLSVDVSPGVYADCGDLR